MKSKHFTISTYIFKDKKVLLLYHAKHRKWLPPGGHLEPNETPPEGAKREVLEETGLEIAFIKQENLWIDCWNAISFERPYLCLLEHIPQQGSSEQHLHMDLIYLATPIGDIEMTAAPIEQKMRWFSIEEVLNLKSDIEIFAETQQVINHIYKSEKFDHNYLT